MTDKPDDAHAEPPKWHDYRKDGYGLAYIVRKFDEFYGVDGEKFVREELPAIIANGKLQGFIDTEMGRLSVLEHGEYCALLGRLTPDGEMTLLDVIKTDHPLEAAEVDGQQ